jgi:hypothetical protein
MVVVGVHRQHDGDGDCTDFRDIKSSITSTGRRAGQFLYIVLIAPKTGARYQLELRRMNEQISAILLKAM